jgi:hypothetical protein
MKHREFAIKNETWGFWVLIRIGGTRESALDRFKRWVGGIYSPPKNGPEATTIQKLGESSQLIWFRRKPRASVIAHEAFHVAYHVMDVQGCRPLTESNEEAYAYLLEWVVAEIQSNL